MTMPRAKLSEEIGDLGAELNVLIEDMTASRIEQLNEILVKVEKISIEIEDLRREVDVAISNTRDIKRPSVHGDLMKISDKLDALASKLAGPEEE